MGEKYQQDYALSNADREDYLWLKQKLRGSVIQSSPMYDHNYFICDDWTGHKSIDWVEHDQALSGIPLSMTDADYVLDLTTANAAHNVMMWAVLQRTLFISNNGIALV